MKSQQQQPNQKCFLEMALKERVALAHNIYITYPRLKAILETIDYCHHFSGEAAEPECLFISGPTGAGKTTVYKDYQSTYPRQFTDEGSIVPVLSVTIPIPATTKNMVTALLKELGDPLYLKGTTYNQTIRLKELLKDCRVELIILDEFQHFIDRDSKKVLDTVAEWLKTLIVDISIPIVLIGLKEAEAVLTNNEQLSRRFANRQILEPFRWSADAGEEFRSFLHIAESQLPLMDKSHLADEEMAFRFFYASDGIVGYVMKLIRYGSYLAIKQGQEKLDLNVLAEAFNQHVLADKPQKKNPFITDDFLKDCLMESELPTSPLINATSNRVKPKKKKLRASDVLNR